MPRYDLTRARRNRPRTSTPRLEVLEGRQLPAASPLAVHASQLVHAQVISSPHHSTTASHQTEATTTHHTATIKAATVSKHTTTKHATTKHTTTKHSTVSAAIVSSKAKSTPMKIKSKLLHIKAYQGFVAGNPVGGTGANTTYYPVAGALTPQQLETAYTTNKLGTSNQGQGETIAIVDELNDTSIISDANTYSSYYNLPQFNTGNGPTMTVTLDSDLGTVASAKGSGVGTETSLDVEMVHALAPQANILLVEVPASGTLANEFAQLLEGVQFAAKQPGVVAVSLSYGYAESSIGSTNVVSQNNTYLATGAAASVAVTVSTGDGSSPLYPATTPNVIAVGGTSLYLTSAQGQYWYETAWGGLAGAGAGGGGASTNFSAPTFQSSNGVTLSTKRTIPDVSLVGDPVTTSAPDPWLEVGGTSAAAPLMAGIVGLAQQERIAAGQPILNSVEIDTAMYEAYHSSSYLTYFHDITLGKNSNVSSSGRTTVAGFSATTGYDEATGIGSPIASQLVPYLTSYVIGT